MKTAFNGGVNADGVVLAPHRPDLCLEFANTLSWRDSDPVESLHSVSDVFEWCIGSGALPEAGVGLIRTWIRSHPADEAALFTDALTIREAIYRIFNSAASGISPSRDDLGFLNDQMSRSPMRIDIAPAADGYGWRVEPNPSAAMILAAVLWSAADLLVSPSLAKVRRCANERCLWLFLDDSKNGARRWCSMQSCGNRAKARRHYIRHKRK